MDQQRRNQLIYILILAASQYAERKKRGEYLSGADFLKQLTESESTTRMRSNLRMRLDTFTALHNWLLAKTKLRSARRSDSAEKLGVFLYTIGHGAHNRELQERFSHSGETIHR